MEKAYGLRTDEATLVRILDQGENYAVLNVGTRSLPLSLPKDEKQIGEYRKDARRVIDGLSKELNPIGLNRFAAALLYELLVEHYIGKHNG